LRSLAWGGAHGRAPGGTERRHGLLDGSGRNGTDPSWAPQPVAAASTSVTEMAQRRGKRVTS